jgi:hypothetical protein
MASSTAARFLLVCELYLIHAHLLISKRQGIDSENDSGVSAPMQVEAHVVTTRSVVSFVPMPDADTVLQNMKLNINELPAEIPGLLSVLDEVAKIHVSISGRSG